ncbi:serine O-acetyltransferase EpsC [Streptomyces telluris]|uniref:serine O-acetyltransferase n=1 Tax=Streptomyces telluris TaxID=2720021 RepID=A0A9X2LGW2_9ACTN|nr:serine O-acetyltransferase EpsC [Streptomyces telluris]MCQ8770918.1 serine O-acetyltransferase [Streptomyces telluris]NJP81502.1 serine acetyltransferase [Streptomyces telluris]
MTPPLPPRPSLLPRCLRLLREDLKVVADRDPAVRSRGEALLAPFLPALWLHRPASGLHARGHRVTARVLSLVGRFLSGGVDIHPGARVGRRLFIDHGAAVIIGEDAVIGDDVTLYHQVTIGAIGWWRDRHRLPGERRHPTLGDRVVVGAGASVLGPVRIGDDSLVGAHALVMADVPAGSRVWAPKSEVHPRGKPSAVRAAGGTEAAADGTTNGSANVTTNVTAKATAKRKRGGL